MESWRKKIASHKLIDRAKKTSNGTMSHRRHMEKKHRGRKNEKQKGKRDQPHRVLVGLSVKNVSEPGLYL